MQLMKRKPGISAIRFSFIACASLSLGSAASSQAAEVKADPTGTWTWTIPANEHGPKRWPQTTGTLNLRLEGERLTGTWSDPKRQPNKGRDVEISEGTLTGDAISFAVIREANGVKSICRYSGRFSANAIQGRMEAKLEFERNGKLRSETTGTGPWEAKRSLGRN
jgi:hypothetical protein